MMITPTDEASLAAGLAGVQATLTSHGQRFDRVEGKLDTVIERIDVVYPELATVKQQVLHQQEKLNGLEADLKDQERFLRKIFFGLLAAVVGLVGDAIWAGWIQFGH